VFHLRLREVVAQLAGLDLEACRLNVESMGLTMRRMMTKKMTSMTFDFKLFTLEMKERIKKLKTSSLTIQKEEKLLQQLIHMMLLKVW